MSNDILGDRMKEYENVQRIYLTKRMPTIIRLDGVSFHTFTKGLNKSYDDKVFLETMWDTAQYLSENIMGCKIAYTQSDEITLLLIDYDNLDTQSWFDKNMIKMISISASMATLAFNKFWSYKVEDADRCLSYCKFTHESDYKSRGLYDKNAWENNKYNNEWIEDWDFKESTTKEQAIEYWETIYSKGFRAMFDSRVFNLPESEVCNCFIWRQQDAIRNSINAIAQFNFSRKELKGKESNQLIDMLREQKQIDFDNYPVYQKQGVCIVKKEYRADNIIRNYWAIDKDIPVFSQDRNYIQQYL